MSGYWSSPSGGVDYTSITVTLIFDGSNTRQCNEVAITDDNIYEDDETFSVTLTTGDEDVTLEPDNGIVTITDDDGSFHYLAYMHTYKYSCDSFSQK